MNYRDCILVSKILDGKEDIPTFFSDVKNLEKDDLFDIVHEENDISYFTETEYMKG